MPVCAVPDDGLRPAVRAAGAADVCAGEGGVCHHPGPRHAQAGQGQGIPLRHRHVRDRQARSVEGMVNACFFCPVLFFFSSFFVVVTLLSQWKVFRRATQPV